MNHHTFSYLSSQRKPIHTNDTPQRATSWGGASTAAHTPPPRAPIRVTPSALPSLLYAIIYTIEFHAPVGPHPAAIKEANRNSGVTSTLSALSAMSTFFSRTSSATSSVTVPVRSVEEEAEEAALRRLHEQTFVVPITQVIHQLGDIHVVVCETHNPSIDPAYREALLCVDRLVKAHRDRLERRRAVPGSSHSSLMDRSKNRMGASSPDNESPPQHLTTVTPAVPTTATAASVPYIPLATVFSAENQQAKPQQVVAARTLMSPKLRVNPEEVGLEFSVRLYVSERRWGAPRQKALAEFVFPVVRTKDEDTLFFDKASAVRGGVAGTSSSSGDYGADAAAAAATNNNINTAATSTDVSFHVDVNSTTTSHTVTDIVLANNPVQIQDALFFVSECFYKAMSMDTFTDFTSGELLFDIQVKEKRSFP